MGVVSGLASTVSIIALMSSVIFWLNLFLASGVWSSLGCWLGVCVLVSGLGEFRCGSEEPFRPSAPVMAWPSALLSPHLACGGSGFVFSTYSSGMMG